MCKIKFLLRFWKFVSTILSILYQLSNTYIIYTGGKKSARCQYLDISESSMKDVCHLPLILLVT